MSWKFRLAILLAVILATVALLKLPSQADTNTDLPAKTEDNQPVTEGKITTYPNGVSKIEPRAFAVTENVRDMPTVDPDRLIKRSSFTSTEKRREQLLAQERAEKGLPALSEKEKEINEQNSERIRKSIPGAGEGDKFQDPLVGRAANLADSPQTMPTPSLTFDGATQADNTAVGAGSVYPPDTNGDVGPNHYVSSVNLVYKIFNKNGTVAAGPIATNALFAALPLGDPCRVRNDGDPIVIYDSLADRWHISQFGLPTGNASYQCVALSVTGDPTGAYYVWSYTYPLPNSINDYPKVGVWTDAYHMTFNQFVNDTFKGFGILSQDRAKALAGDPNAGAVYVNVGTIDPTAGGTLPGDIDGFVPPPVGMAEVIGEFRATEYGDPVDGIRLYKWIPNFASPGNSTLSILPDIALAPFDANEPPGRNHIEVMGADPSQYLDSLADRSMHRFAYRNFGTISNPINSYVGNFSVNVGGVTPTSAATYQTGIRWFEIRRNNDTFSVFDQGTHNLTPGDPVNGLNNWMGSIAQDNKGNIALGFSQAGTTQKADIKIAGRTNNMANSGTLNEGEALLYPAGGIQTGTADRWGDYSAMNVDPTDDCTFWYTQEYYAVTSGMGWSTRIGKFRYPSCTDAPKAAITGTITFCDGGAPINKASVDATGGFDRLTIANGTYSIIVSPGTYTVTAGKAGGFVSSSQTASVANGGTATVNFCLTGVPVVASQTPAIVSESCGVANGSLDPGEQVTISLPLQNTGAAGTSNLTATLLSTGGVTALSNSQTYGALAPGSAAQSRNFNFKVDAGIACGSTVTLTFNITDGATGYGTVTKTYMTGVRSTTPNFSENFDAVAAPTLPTGWTTAQTFGTAITWITSATTPSSPPNDAFANDAPTVATAALITPAIAIQRPDAQLSFKNLYDTETGVSVGYDGMVLEYTINNGTTWIDIIDGGGAFVSGGYNKTISSNYGSKIAGRKAWSGNSGGYIDTVVNLPASLAGQTVQFRWVMASDSDTGGNGVRIDNVQVFGTSQCNTCAGTVCRFQRRSDFDGDGKSDVSVYRPSNGVWYLLNSQTGFYAVQFGNSTDRIVPADYDGDGKTDEAVYRDGNWYLLRSSAGFAGISFGLASDIPQPADFDGDGKAELAVYRPSNGNWYVLNLVNNQFSAVQFGNSTDKPVVGDYDGDCKADYAVYRDGNWYILGSKTGFQAVQFGDPTDKPVVGDYDGDGKSDEAVYRPSSGNWYILGSTSGFSGVQFGISTDLPAPADYDGDGKTDEAVYRNGNWYILGSRTGFQAVQFGDPTDKPVPNAFVP